MVTFYTDVKEIKFTNKQNIDWEAVENYVKTFIGKKYIVKETGDTIIIGSDFPNEFAESKYTKKLKGAYAKAKANLSQNIGELIEYAQNRRWVENKNDKHRKNASGGWYRYDVGFTIPVKHEGKISINKYLATAVVRIKKNKLYLYDIINIKKEASTPL